MQCSYFWAMYTDLFVLHLYGETGRQSLTVLAHRNIFVWMSS